MRIKDINGIINDLIEFEGYINPLNHVWIEHTFNINLISGKTKPSEKDSLYEFYIGKRKWFAERVKKLKGNLRDFESATITVFGKKEKIEINYNGKKFSQEKVYDGSLGIKKFREDIKKLKPEKINKK